MEMVERHRLDLDDDMIRDLIANPQAVRLSAEDLDGMQPQQKVDTVTGEYYAILSSMVAKMASDRLIRAQWGYTAPDWYDHRHRLLNPEEYFTDFWTMSADNVLSVLPLDGRVLNLCAGDGYYDFYFWRRRASEIVCVDANPEAHRQAMRLHSAENIQHLLADVLTYEPEASYFDVVVIRGAIEHFSRENQQVIFAKAAAALKPGGWFCGDTVANPAQETKMLEAHEHEWADEQEMRAELSEAFSEVETRTLESRTRTTLFWRWHKPE